MPRGPRSRSAKGASKTPGSETVLRIAELVTESSVVSRSSYPRELPNRSFERSVSVMDDGSGIPAREERKDNALRICVG